MAKKQVTQADVEKIARLANLKVSEKEKKLFSEQFTQSLDVIDQLQEVDKLPPEEYHPWSHQFLWQ